MAKYFNESGYKTMAIITENTDYATAQRALIKNFGAEKTVFNEAVEPGTKDYRSLITRLKAMEFDVFVPNGQSDSTNAAMIQQFREASLEQPIVGTDTTDSQVVIDIAKDAAEGVHMVNVPTSGEGKTFETDFNAKYGKPSPPSPGQRTRMMRRAC